MCRTSFDAKFMSSVFSRVCLAPEPQSSSHAFATSRLCIKIQQFATRYCMCSSVRVRVQGLERPASKAMRDLKSLTRKLTFRRQPSDSPQYPRYWKVDADSHPETGRFEDAELVPALQAMVSKAWCVTDKEWLLWAIPAIVSYMELVSPVPSSSCIAVFQNTDNLRLDMCSAFMLG